MHPSNRPPRNTAPSAKLSADNGGELQLASHHSAVAAAKLKAKQPPKTASSTALSQSQCGIQSTVPDIGNVTSSIITQASSSATTGQKRCIDDSDDFDNSLSEISTEREQTAQPISPPAKQKRKKRKQKSKMLTGEYRDFLTTTFINLLSAGPKTLTIENDVVVQPIELSDTDEPQKLNQAQPTADIIYFFKPAPKIAGSNKGRVICKTCV